jgi:hypothetical protein
MIWEKQHEAVEALDCFVYTLTRDPQAAFVEQRALVVGIKKRNTVILGLGSLKSLFSPLALVSNYTLSPTGNYQTKCYAGQLEIYHRLGMAHPAL